MEHDELNQTPEDELNALKARADMLGVRYHPSIGLEKLREKVNAAIEGTPSEDEPEQATVAAAAEPAKESEAARRQRLKAEAGRLVRIRLTCMNPAKNEWPGEIINVGNSVVGTFSKFIPFNADDGWHVPHFIYQVLKDRQCQVFTTVVDERGNKVRKGKLIPEFAIEVLPDLTAEELKELAARQAATKAID